MVIASALEPALADMVAAVDPRIRVHHRPDLLPDPRWPSDHVGTARTLTPDQDDEWTALLAQAEVLFDFDWRRPERTTTPLLAG